MRIGILTGGGDVPGLNACIRSITLSADDLGWEVIGFRRGWEGVLDDRSGRSGQHRRQQPRAHPRRRARDRPDGRHDPPHLAHRSADAPGRRPDRSRSCDVLERLGIDAMVTLGGDGTLRFSAHLAGSGRARHLGAQDDGQ